MTEDRSAKLSLCERGARNLGALVVGLGGLLDMQAAFGSLLSTALSCLTFGCLTLGCLTLGCLTLGCGANAAMTTSSSGHSDAAENVRSVDFARVVPSDADWELILQPRALLQHGSTRALLFAVFEESRWDRFRTYYGLDPRELDVLWLVQHREGLAIFAHGQFDAEFAIHEAGARMAPLESSAMAPFIRRVGFLGSRRLDISALNPRSILIVHGTPRFAAALLAAVAFHLEEGLAERQESISIPVLPEAERSSGMGSLPDTPAVFRMSHPLGLPIDSGAGLLLARQETLMAELRPVSSSQLGLRLVLTGEFPPGAQQNFYRFSRVIARSGLGRLLALDVLLESLDIACCEQGAVLRMSLDAQRVASGLRTLFHSEMTEMLAFEPDDVARTEGPLWPITESSVSSEADAPVGEVTDEVEGNAGAGATPSVRSSDAASASSGSIATQERPSVPIE